MKALFQQHRIASELHDIGFQVPDNVCSAFGDSSNEIVYVRKTLPNGVIPPYSPEELSMIHALVRNEEYGGTSFTIKMDTWNNQFLEQINTDDDGQLYGVALYDKNKHTLSFPDTGAKLDTNTRPHDSVPGVLSETLSCGLVFYPNFT